MIESGEDMQQTNLAETETFKIGAVARLTGLSSHTIRKWESRYGAVAPGRTERGQRLYSSGDVERLTLIRRLVDAGVAPREVASAPLSALLQKCEHLSAVQATAGVASTQPVRIAVIGRNLAATLDRSAPADGLIEVLAHAGTASALDAKRLNGRVDLLVYECDTVTDETRHTVDALLLRFEVQCAVIVYRFSTQGDLLSLQSAQLATLRAPTDRRTLEQVVVELFHSCRTSSTAVRAPAARSATARAEVPAPRLSREAIARIARISPRVRCECPHHLADIILGLLAFEEYSAACESRNPEDMALHHYLWRSAAQARVLFEDAIERVAAAEGIDLEG